jgi:plastocyanin
MTTETPDLEDKSAATEAEGDAAADAAPVPAAPEKTPFWDRPAVDRYLVPFVLPLLVVTAVVVLILNISRIFLSTHGNVDVLVGTGILLTILIGASILSASPKMRSSSLALVAGGFVVVIMLGGWLLIGNAELKGGAEATLPAEGPASEALAFSSSNALRFDPSKGDAQTGIAKITLNDQSGEHTLHFEDGKTLFETLHVTNAGDSVSGRAFFGEAGDYVFYCTIPGHREAGMEGVVTVTGDTTTVDAAEAAATANPAGGGGAGAGGAGATPTSAP